LTVTRAVSLKLEHPPRAVYEALSKTENLLNLLPAKIKIQKAEKGIVTMKFSGFGFEGPVTGSIEGKELEGEQYLVAFKAAGETSVGVGIIMYKAKVDFTLKFEIIPIGSATDLRIELTYSSPYEDEMIKNAIEFLNALSDNISKNISKLIPKTVRPPKATQQTVRPPKAEQRVPEQAQKLQTPAQPTPQQQKAEEKAGGYPLDLDLSRKLGDPAFFSELLKNSSTIGTEFGQLGPELISRLLEISGKTEKHVLAACRVSNDKLRILLKGKAMLAAWAEVGGRAMIGEEALKAFSGKDIICPLYELNITEEQLRS